MTTTVALTQLDVSRFLARVDIAGSVLRSELGPCHLWTGPRDRDGYGLVHVRAADGWITKRATHVAFFIDNGHWPNPCALHHCDNPPCVRGAHIFEGTNADNMADRDAKGRQATGPRNGRHTQPDKGPRGGRHWARSRPELLPRGERNGSRIHPERLTRGEAHHATPFTASDVVRIREARAAGASIRSLAEEHGVVDNTIWCIVKRLSWRHVP